MGFVFYLRLRLFFYVLYSEVMPWHDPTFYVCVLPTKQMKIPLTPFFKGGICAQCALVCAKGDVIAGMFSPHEVRIETDNVCACAFGAD